MPRYLTFASAGTRADVMVMSHEQGKAEPSASPSASPCGYRTERTRRWSGLCSSVWSGDDRHATSVAESLRTGVTLFHNHNHNHNATAVDERAPFGGFNQSSVGCELGHDGLVEFTETLVMSIPA